MGIVSIENYATVTVFFNVTGKIRTKQADVDDWLRAFPHISRSPVFAVFQLRNLDYYSAWK